MGWVTRRESPASQLEIGPGSEGLRFIRPLGWTLRQCGPPDHIVQLYQDQQFLNRAVCRFAASALANGEGVILVPTAAHWEAFKPRLEAEGVDIDRAKDAGQLTVVDADELLPQFMRDAMPDEAGGSRRVGESSRRRRRRTQRLIGCQVNIMLSTDVIGNGDSLIRQMLAAHDRSGTTRRKIGQRCLVAVAQETWSDADRRK